MSSAVSGAGRRREFFKASHSCVFHGLRAFAGPAVIFRFPFPLPHLRNDLMDASPTQTTISSERKMAIASLSTSQHEVGEDAGETLASGPRPVQYSQTL